MAKGAKCDPHEICEECPEWIFTLADLIMCMMGLFVLLWVLKPPPGQQGKGELDPKWLEVVAKIREAFKYVPDPESKDPVDMHMLMKKIEMIEPPLKNPGKGGETKVEKEGAEGTDPLVMNVRPGKHVAVGGRLAFAAGDAKLSPETVRVLDEIVKIVKGHRNIIHVKGHAALDDFPDGATQVQLMDLSIRRAAAIANYMVAHEVSPDVVRVQGCSTFEPVVQQTYTVDAQALNRRVEVEVTDILVRERQDTGRPKGAGAPAEKPPAEAGHEKGHGH